MTSGTDCILLTSSWARPNSRFKLRCSSLMYSYPQWLFVWKASRVGDQINATYFLESEKFEVSFEFFEGCVEVCFVLGCREGTRGDGRRFVQWINGNLDDNAAGIVSHVDVSHGQAKDFIERGPVDREKINCELWGELARLVLVNRACGLCNELRMPKALTHTVASESRKLKLLSSAGTGERSSHFESPRPTLDAFWSIEFSVSLERKDRCIIIGPNPSFQPHRATATTESLCSFPHEHSVVPHGSQRSNPTKSIQHDRIHKCDGLALTTSISKTKVFRSREKNSPRRIIFGNRKGNFHLNPTHLERS